MCHTEGVQGAPRIGDAGAWMLRYPKGITTLYEHTINGYNLMPIKGNCPTCTDQQIRSTVNYLLAHSLTTDQRRLSLMEKPKKLTIADGKKVYEAQCGTCHDGGKNNAPVMGDKEAWKPLLNKNIDGLFESVYLGQGDAHPESGCDSCSKAELLVAVKYLAQQSADGVDYRLW